MMLCLTVSTQYWHATDRQTDRQTDGSGIPIRRERCCDSVVRVMHTYRALKTILLLKTCSICFTTGEQGTSSQRSLRSFCLNANVVHPVFMQLSRMFLIVLDSILTGVAVIIINHNITHSSERAKGDAEKLLYFIQKSRI